MPLDPATGEHRCTACMMCVKACPNHSIDCEKSIGEDGKPKPRASSYTYNMGSCIYCNLCVESCAFGAIIMSDDYETGTQNKADLTLDLVAEKYQLKGKKVNWWVSKFKSGTPAKFAATVSPVTVKQSPCNNPFFNRYFITEGTPP